VGEPSEEWPATANDVAPDELIKFGTVTTLAHLVQPGSKDATVSRRRTSSLFKRGRRPAPTTSLGDLARLPWSHAERCCADVHDLTLCTRRDEA
jgi:hypothetical protein